MRQAQYGWARFQPWPSIMTLLSLSGSSACLVANDLKLAIEASILHSIPSVTVANCHNIINRGYFERIACGITTLSTAMVACLTERRISYKNPVHDFSCRVIIEDIQLDVTSSCTGNHMLKRMIGHS